MTRARLVEQSLRDQRATAADVAGELHVPPRHLEELDRGSPDLGLCVARERVGEEDDGPAASCRGSGWGWRPSREPPVQRLALEPRQLTAPVDSADPISKQADWPGAGDPVGNRGERGADAIQGPDVAKE